MIFLMDDTMSTSEEVKRKLGVMPLTVIPEGDIQKMYGQEEDGDGSPGVRRKKHRRKKSENS